MSPEVRNMTPCDGLHRFLELSLGGWISGMNDSGMIQDTLQNTLCRQLTAIDAW